MHLIRSCGRSVGRLGLLGEEFGSGYDFNFGVGQSFRLYCNGSAATFG